MLNQVTIEPADNPLQHRLLHQSLQVWLGYSRLQTVIDRKIQLRTRVDDELCILKELTSSLPQKSQREPGPPLIHILVE